MKKTFDTGLDKKSAEFFVRSLRSEAETETDNFDRNRRFGSDYLARSLRSRHLNGGEFLSRTMRAGLGADFLSRTMRSRNSKPVRSPPVSNNYLIRAMWSPENRHLLSTWLKQIYLIVLLVDCWSELFKLLSRNLSRSLDNLQALGKINICTELLLQPIGLINYWQICEFSRTIFCSDLSKESWSSGKSGSLMSKRTRFQSQWPSKCFLSSGIVWLRKSWEPTILNLFSVSTQHTQ